MAAIPGAYPSIVLGFRRNSKTRAVGLAKQQYHKRMNLHNVEAGAEINQKTLYSRRSLPQTLVVGFGPSNGPPICSDPSQFFQNAQQAGPPTPARDADVYLIRMTCFGNAVRQPS